MYIEYNVNIYFVFSTQLIVFYKKNKFTVDSNDIF